MKSDSPKLGGGITIVIPAKDRIDLLRHCIRSVCSQSTLPAEIIVSDDGSNPPLCETLDMEELAVPLRFVRSEYSRGGASAINDAVRLAHTDIVATLDSDDCFQPDYVEEVSEFWRSCKSDVALLATGFFWCDNELVPYKVQSVKRDINLYNLLIYGNFVGGSSVMSFRRDAFLNAGGHPLLDAAHDYGLLIAIARRGNISSLTRPLTLYRSPTLTRAENQTRKVHRQLRGSFKLRRSLNDREKLIFDARFRILVSKQLLISGKKKAAFRILVGVPFHQIKYHKKEIVSFIAQFVIGVRNYNSILALFAVLRTHLYKLAK